MDVFGVNENQHSTQAMTLIVAKFDVNNKYFQDFSYKDVNTNERVFSFELIEKAKKSINKELFIYDRGFSSFTLLKTHIDANLDFIIRVHHRFNKSVIAFLETDLKEGIIDLEMTDNAYSYYNQKGVDVDRKTTIKVRIVRYRIKDKNNDRDYILLTSLDAKTASITELQELYAQRWSIETAFGILKNSIYLEMPSGYTPQVVEQDLHVSFIIFNISAYINLQNESKIEEKCKNRKFNYQASYQSVISAIRMCIHQLINPQKYKQMLRVIGDHILRCLSPIRPGRSFKRRKTTRGRNGKYTPPLNFKQN